MGDTDDDAVGRLSSVTVNEALPMVQRFCPVFAIHHKEKYLPCGVDCFLDRCQLVRWSRPDPEADPEIDTLLLRRECTPERITEVLRAVPKRTDHRLVLENKAHTVGQPVSELSTVPVHATVKQVARNNGQRDLEITYIATYANNGSYRVFGKKIGEHEGDVEHMTARCTLDGRSLLACYYGAHRHGDGTWVAARDVPVDPQTGRLVAYVAKNGHGLYPKAKVNFRIFGVANDITSSKGPVWAPSQCVVVVPPARGGPAHEQRIPVVPDTGGQSYEPVKASQVGKPVKLVRPNGPAGHQPDAAHAGAGLAGDGPQASQVVAQYTQWLKWRVRWGTQLSPQQQQWFKQAEHPKGNTTLRRTFTPWKRP